MTIRKKRIAQFLALLLLFGLVAIAGVAYYAYQMVFIPNVNATNNDKEYEVFIPTNARYSDVLDALGNENILKNATSFDLVAKQMNYPNKIYAGRYLINDKMNNRELVSMLRAGKQTPFNLTINNIRLKEQLIDLISKNLEADSTELSNLLSDALALKQHNLTPESVVSIFMEDTYQFNWNTSAQQFFDRMLKEYEKFWTPERKAKAKKLKLTPYESIVLAAIVQEEVMRTDEMNRVARVYLNRIDKNWKLEADPTVKYAVGDFTISRVLKKHLRHDSPYNTYLYEGLPPGPIRIPSKKAVEATINPETHNYMFFCAKEDRSGYHNFAETYKQHLLNARKYHKELNRRAKEKRQEAAKAKKDSINKAKGK